MVADKVGAARLNNAAASVNSRDTGTSSVSRRGEPSTIRTISGISISSGKELQGELMFGRGDSGKPMFWLKGQDKNYALRGADGKPVTNAMEAEQRAIQLITVGGATRLREMGQTKSTFDLPGHQGNGQLTVDLTSRDINSKGGEGRVPGGFLGMTNQGQAGSALSEHEKDVAHRFQGEGLRVEVVNANPKGDEKNGHMHAVVTLSNGAAGGGQYARSTVNQNPGAFQPDAALWSVPKGASAEFKRGYWDERARIGMGQVGGVIKEVGEGLATGRAARAQKKEVGEGLATGRAARAQKGQIHARPITTELVLPGSPTKKAPTVVPVSTRTERSPTRQSARTQSAAPTQNPKPVQSPAPMSPKNSAQLKEQLADDAKMVAHFEARAFGKSPGSSPTSYLFGGHAVSGPFAGLKGGSALELEAHAEARVKEMLHQGTMQELSGGAFNKTYIYKPTGQVVRIGVTNSEDVSATASYSNFRGRGIGAQLDLDQSLFIPKATRLDANHSHGFGVLVMDRVPGVSLSKRTLEKAKAEMSPSQLAQLVHLPDKAADAVVDMHMHRRAHGDLHQGNVMFDKATGEIRVIDFGNTLRTSNRTFRLNDVYGLGTLINAFGHKTGEPLMTQGQALYLKALDRYAGPDRRAPIYKNHPELYEPHVKRFNERKAALRSEMAQ